MEIDYLNYDFAAWAKRAIEHQETGNKPFACVSCPVCWKPVGHTRIEGVCDCKTKIVVTEWEAVDAHGLRAAKHRLQDEPVSYWAEHG